MEKRIAYFYDCINKILNSTNWRLLLRSRASNEASKNQNNPRIIIIIWFI